MATKKVAGKKAAGSEAKVEAPAVKAASKTSAVKKTAAKKTPSKTVDVQGSAAESKGHGHEAKGAKASPSHEDIARHAYLLWERDGKKHGHHEQYWKRAEEELRG